MWNPRKNCLIFLEKFQKMFVLIFTIICGTIRERAIGHFIAETVVLSIRRIFTKILGRVVMDEKSLRNSLKNTQRKEFS